MMNGKYLVCNKCKFPFTSFELFTYFLSSFEDGTYERYSCAIQVCRYATGTVPWVSFYHFSTLPPHLSDSNSPYLRVSDGLFLDYENLCLALAESCN